MFTFVTAYTGCVKVKLESKNKTGAPCYISIDVCPCLFVCKTGPSRNTTLGYDWAIVSAGPPRTPGIKGCRTDVAFLGLFEVHQGGTNSLMFPIVSD